MVDYFPLKRGFFFDKARTAHREVTFALNALPVKVISSAIRRFIVASLPISFDITWRDPSVRRP